MAGALGRHQPFVSGIEAGQQRVDVVELLELADVIGFEPVALLAELQATPKR